MYTNTHYETPGYAKTYLTYPYRFTILNKNKNYDINVFIWIKIQVC
jgi:hypothetical protein